MFNDLEKAIINAIFRGLRPLEILEELRAKSLILGDESERRAEDSIRNLEARIAEAKASAEESAYEAAKLGLNWKQLVEYLEKPGLLPSGAVIHFASKAFERLDAEK